MPFPPAPNRLWFRVSSESTDSKISSGIIWQKLRGRVPSTVWTGMSAYRESARNKPHSVNMHGFTAHQSYNTTYKTHYKPTTLHIDSVQNEEANIFSKNNS